MQRAEKRQILSRPAKVVSAGILIPIQAYSIGCMTKIVCFWWKERDYPPLFQDLFWNDLPKLLFFLSLFGFVAWAKSKVELDWPVAEFVAAAVAIAWCLNAAS